MIYSRHFQTICGLILRIIHMMIIIEFYVLYILCGLILRIISDMSYINIEYTVFANKYPSWDMHVCARCLKITPRRRLPACREESGWGALKKSWGHGTCGVDGGVALLQSLTEYLVKKWGICFDPSPPKKKTHPAYLALIIFSRFQLHIRLSECGWATKLQWPWFAVPCLSVLYGWPWLHCQSLGRYARWMGPWILRWRWKGPASPYPME